MSMGVRSIISSGVIPKRPVCCSSRHPGGMRIGLAMSRHYLQTSSMWSRWIRLVVAIRGGARRIHKR